MKNIILIVLFSFGTANAQSLKIMTYNIRLDVASDGENSWNNRKDYFTSQIQFYEPDIMGVQEALPNQMKDIDAALPKYTSIGMAREGVGKGEASSIFYKKERLKIVKQNTFWLSETPDQISMGWDAICNRVCTYALFQDLKTKKQFWVFNTHLDHIGEEARTKGLALILATIAKENTKKSPVFLMGDFNLEPDDERVLNVKKEMDDTRELSKEKPFGPAGTFNNFKHNEPVTACIDYIFMSKESSFTIRKFAVLSDSKDLKYPSDHLPVIIEIK